MSWFENTKLMLIRRGYAIDETSSKSNEYVVATSNNDRALAYFVKFVKVSIDIIKFVLKLSTQLGDIVNIIIVYAKSLTSEAKNAVAVNKVFIFETFSFDEMSYDLIDIVPRHSLVAERPKEWQKFPVILATDMVARYYRFKRGDIVQIDEDGVLAYRKCV
jgi:DNA-directed RNA polymerase subunit H (RpoH/RPB5)